MTSKLVWTINLIPMVTNGFKTNLSSNFSFMASKNYYFNSSSKNQNNLNGTYVDGQILSVKYYSVIFDAQLSKRICLQLLYLPLLKCWIICNQTAKRQRLGSHWPISIVRRTRILSVSCQLHRNQHTPASRPTEGLFISLLPRNKVRMHYSYWYISQFKL